MRRSILMAGTALLVSLPAFAQPLRIDTVVVTASALGQTGNETAMPVTILAGQELMYRRQATLGETLAGLPGINTENFGGGSSRPVIRGQTAPRVRILSDGSSIDDASAISPDHAISTEPLLLRGIEVLHGPATLLYGGSAIGGAVNLLDEKVPTFIPEGGFSGAIEGRAGTADDERSIVGGATAGFGPFALRLEGIHRTADDYRVHNSFGSSRVAGSYADSTTFTVGGSWIGNAGYLGAAFTSQRSTYGLPGHAHEYESCHPHGLTLHCGGHDDHDDEDDHDDHDDDHAAAAGGTPARADVPYIKLRNDRFDIRGEYRDPIPQIEKVRLRLSFTDYAHDEAEDGVVETTFSNMAHDARFEVTHSPIGGLRGVFGFQNTGSDFSIVGTEMYLPPSFTSNSAIFLMETLQVGQVRLELAARQEWQSIDGSVAGRAEHTPFSISGAAIWDLDSDYSLALSVGRSQRAPNVQELFSNTVNPFRGVHVATNTWEIGTPTLKSETAHSVDLTFRKTKGDTTFTLGAYHQDFSDYIFAETLDTFEDFRLIRYTAAGATFQGVDGEIRHQFTPNFATSIFGDYVRAELKNGLGNVPRIPAGRLGARAEGEWNAFHADLELYHVFAQDDIASFETRTPGYAMLNATFSYQIDLGRADSELFLRASNLTDTLAYNHTSFIKNAAPLRGRNFLFGIRTSF
jgi:iron complex outermembrane receptor protein